MGARRNFFLGAKATRPFPISPFPFFSLPFPSSLLHVVLPSLPSGHLNPALGESCIANYSENQLVLPFLPAPSSPLLLSISLPSHTLFSFHSAFPYLSSFFPLSSLFPFSQFEHRALEERWVSKES